VLAHFFRAGDSLIDRDRQLDTELIGYCLDLDHYIPNQRANIGVAHHLYQRSAGQCANWIKGHVAQQLHPDFVTEPRSDGAAQSSLD